MARDASSAQRSKRARVPQPRANQQVSRRLSFPTAQYTPGGRHVRAGERNCGVHFAMKLARPAHGQGTVAGRSAASGRPSPGHGQPKKVSPKGWPLDPQTGRDFCWHWAAPRLIAPARSIPPSHCEFVEPMPSPLTVSPEDLDTLFGFEDDDPPAIHKVGCQAVDVVLIQFSR